MMNAGPSTRRPVAFWGPTHREAGGEGETEEECEADGRGPSRQRPHVHPVEVEHQAGLFDPATNQWRRGGGGKGRGTTTKATEDAGRFQLSLPSPRFQLPFMIQPGTEPLLSSLILLGHIHPTSLHTLLGWGARRRALRPVVPTGRTAPPQSPPSARECRASES